jgi:hypothetical protein
MYTQKEIDAIVKEVHEALLESISADRVETEAKVAKAKAHLRLLNAKEALSAIRFN